MSNRRDQHEARKAALAALGKPLSRRARSHCELCGADGRLDVVALEGNPEEEPDPDWALMLCLRCQDLPRQEPSSLRFLETTMWSELQPAQILAVRTLRSLDASWASEALEGLYLDPDREALI